jgi:hypothetical protein
MRAIHGGKSKQPPPERRAFNLKQKESNGKRSGSSNKKIGNAHLRWAFSEAAQIFLRGNNAGQKYFNKISNKHGKSKALSILAHKLGRTVYYTWDTILNY